MRLISGHSALHIRQIAEGWWGCLRWRGWAGALKPAWLRRSLQTSVRMWWSAVITGNYNEARHGKRQDVICSHQWYCVAQQCMCIYSHQQKVFRCPLNFPQFQLSQLKFAWLLVWLHSRQTNKQNKIRKLHSCTSCTLDVLQVTSSCWSIQVWAGQWNMWVHGGHCTTINCTWRLKADS